MGQRQESDQDARRLHVVENNRGSRRQENKAPARCSLPLPLTLTLTPTCSFTRRAFTAAAEAVMELYQAPITSSRRTIQRDWDTLPESQARQPGRAPVQ